MKRRHAVLALVVLVPPGLYGVYQGWVAPEDRDPPPVVRVEPRSARSAEFEKARRTYDFAAMDAFLREQQERVARLRADDSPEVEDGLLVLGEACLERALAASHDKGMRVGEPIYTELPQTVRQWLARAESALDELREMGVETSETFRMRSAILSNRITGLASAWNLNGKVTEALDRAEELDEQNPRVQVARGVRRLLAPRMLGHDPEQALAHLRKAMEALTDDERPRVFAAMAEWLQGRRESAREWLEEAVRINPDNLFAQVALRRIGRGEEHPFAADVSAEEKAAVTAGSTGR